MPDNSTGRRIAALLAMTTGVLSLTFCASSSAAATPAPPRSSCAYRGRAVISGPQTLHPGATAFRVRGAAGHRVLLFRPRHGQSAATLASDLNAFVSTSRPRRVITDFVPASGANVGHTLYATVQLGRYYVVVPQHHQAHQQFDLHDRRHWHANIGDHAGALCRPPPSRTGMSVGGHTPDDRRLRHDRPEQHERLGARTGTRPDARPARPSLRSGPRSGNTRACEPYIR